MSIFCRFYSIFDGKILLANNVDPDKTPHNVASDLGLHCLPMTFYGFPGKNGLSHVRVGSVIHETSRKLEKLLSFLKMAKTWRTCVFIQFKNQCLIVHKYIHYENHLRMHPHLAR